MTFGVIVGNRGFFPDHLAQSGRAEMLAAIEKAGYQAVAPGPEETKFGAVESARGIGMLRGFCSRNIARRSTASSSRCPISARSAHRASRGRQSAAPVAAAVQESRHALSRLEHVQHS